MKYYKIIYILLIFQSCNTTTLSDKEASEISNLRVEILIEDGAKNKSLNHINAFIYKDGKKIINNNIKIQLNGKPLELFVRQGNYYDKYPVYMTKDLMKSEFYYFEIILPDSIKYPLAYIKPTEITTEFSFPKNIDLDQDFVFNWKNNNLLADLEIWKGVHQKDNINSSSGGRYAESTIHHTIKKDSGNYNVKKSFYEDSLTMAHYLNIRISSMQKGLINPELRANSNISYNYLIEKTIWVEEE